ncbi:MAG: excinuclease ABC subunit UvrA [Phycisphaerales bacterium]|nr:excinuclease ABC subunit UvrA [Phycisphaerales bacterium]
MGLYRVPDDAIRLRGRWRLTVDSNRGRSVSSQEFIRVVGARQHNLRNINVDIPRDRLTVLTGLSGSGKSSLAFDTIYAEGERKYVESLTPYARQFLEQMPKPDVDRIDGLSPTVAIEQRQASTNPRSTVATTTEIYDYLRILFARVGRPHCWKCRRPITRQTTAQIVDAILNHPPETRVVVLAPVHARPGIKPDELLEEIANQGFVRVRLDGRICHVEDVPDPLPESITRVDAVVDRLALKDQVARRLADSIELALRVGRGRAAALIAPGTDQERELTFSDRFACIEHPDVVIDELAPRLFSFNSPYGACPQCSGLGTVLEFDPDLIVADRDLSLANGAVTPWRHTGKRMNGVYARMIESFCKHFDVVPQVPYRNIPAKQARILMHGTKAAEAREFGIKFEGVVPNLERRWQSTDSESVKQRLHQFQSEAPCKTCHGARLRPEALSVTIAEKNIAEMCDMDIAQAQRFFDDVRFEGESAVIAEQPLREIRNRLAFLNNVGVEYLGLSRGSATLSGGEAQRIRLATQIGSGLVGMCYVLDEPTIGLHQRDSQRLVDTLQHLARAGNTVLVVEHDEEVIRAADYIVDIGPGAGVHGGRLIFQGPLDELMACEESVTAQYLTGAKSIPVPDRRRRVVMSNAVEIRGAAQNNLKDLTVRFPLACFVAVTGVSGSGKSTLVNHILLRALHRRISGGGRRPGRHEQIIGASRVDKVIEIDQSPIGRTPRSNPATYVGVFDLIRRLYAHTREAKIRGHGPGRFSFNVKGGRCEHCQGQGTKRIEMHFLPDVFVECDACHGTRYNRETLEVRFRGKNIADVLDMQAEEASQFFQNFSKIKQQLRALCDVGLGYIKLGQSSITLSGGEAQRVKLAAELGKPATGHTMYILDEPTTGLHFADIHKLLQVLNRIVELGHSVVVIEHNLDVIKVADWVIDLGPEGGERGGRIVAEGVPEDVARDENSHTGKLLAGRLWGDAPPAVRNPKGRPAKRGRAAKTG